MNLTELQKESHAIARDHGCWDTERTFGDLIALIHSALSEALEAYQEYGDCLFHYRWHPMEDEVANMYISNDALKPVLGVPSKLADVVIRVANMAEHHGYSLDPVESIGDRNALDVCFEGLVSFGDWIALLHWVTAEATSYKGVASEHLVVDALAFLIIGVQQMAAHYGIDLDAAIAAKMEPLRSRPR